MSAAAASPAPELAPEAARPERCAMFWDPAGIVRCTCPPAADVIVTCATGHEGGFAVCREHLGEACAGRCACVRCMAACWVRVVIER